jgi:ubiquinone/menaquinone biosynthesis C-methylase UbiE
MGGTMSDTSLTDSLKDTGERMVPEYHKGTLIYAEHYTRYLAAKNIIKDKIVLDIACGTGYGSKLISQHARKVFGVDIDDPTINYAKKHYSGKNIEYKVGDGQKIPIEDNSIDVVITFETIEHVEDYNLFLKEVKRVLKDDGVVILSTPNDLEFAEGNHFHLHEFEYNELMSMLKKYFLFIDPYFQATSRFVALGRSNIFNSDGRIEIETLNLAPLDPKQYLYFYLVCSNKEIKDQIDPIGAVGSNYSDREQQILYNALHKAEELNNTLNAKLSANNNHITELEDRLRAIIDSKAYKLALRARSIKSRIIKP